LHNLFYLFALMKETSRDKRDPPTVAIKELLERCFIAVANASDQRDIIRFIA